MLPLDLVWQARITDKILVLGLVPTGQVITQEDFLTVDKTTEANLKVMARTQMTILVGQTKKSQSSTFNLQNNIRFVNYLPKVGGSLPRTQAF